MPSIGPICDDRAIAETRFLSVYSRGMESKDRPPIMAIRVQEACRTISIGRTKLYELINAGDLDVVKVGRATLITMSSLQRLIENNEPASAIPSLPFATIRHVVGE